MIKESNKSQFHFIIDAYLYYKKFGIFGYTSVETNGDYITLRQDQGDTIFSLGIQKKAFWRFYRNFERDRMQNLINEIVNFTG